MRQIKGLTYIIQNNVLKIESQYLIFKASIDGIKTCLLVDNNNEAKLIDKFFVNINKFQFSS